MRKLFFIFFPIILIIAGCGSGGSSSSSSSRRSNSSTTSATTASDIILSWTSPTTNADTTALADITGYKIYFGQVSGTYDGDNSPQDIVCTASCGCTTGVACTYTVAQALLGGGKWCFVITTYDSVANESVYSDEVCRN